MTETPRPPGNTDERPRCWRCRRVLAEYVARPWQVECSRCKATNASAPVPRGRWPDPLRYK
jgi:hypothetical protein